MLRRIAVILNVLVILTGVGFVLREVYLGASLSLLAGGLNILMLRLPDADQPPRISLLPIAFNILMMTVGIQGTALGAAYFYGQRQGSAPLDVQQHLGLTLMILCPAFAIAAIVSSVVFFRRAMAARRGLR